MPKIVLAGQDLHLLETRAEVVKRTGAGVVCCAVFQAMDVVKREMPDLLVLCHTIGQEEAEAIAEKLHMCCPKTKTLLMVSEVREDRFYQYRKFDATSLAAPARLVARATELLHRPPHYVTEVAGDRFRSTIF